MACVAVCCVVFVRELAVYCCVLILLCCLFIEVGCVLCVCVFLLCVCLFVLCSVSDVCWLLLCLECVSVARCVLLVASGLLFVVWRSLFWGLLSVGCCLLFDVCCFGVRC